MNKLLEKSDFTVRKLNTKNLRQKEHSLSTYCLNESEYKLSKTLLIFNNSLQFFSRTAILLETLHNLIILTT